MPYIEKDRNAEIQLHAVHAMNAQLCDQIDSLNTLEECDAAVRSAKSWCGRNFGRKSERNAGRGRDDGPEDKDESEECLQHRKREISEAQCLHVLDNRELQDYEA